MGYLGATLTQVFTCARGANVSLRDVTIGQMGNGASKCEWRHAPDFGILKKAVNRVESCLGRRQLTFACSRRPWTGVARDLGVGSYEKARIERMYLSLCRRTFKLKSFVPELRSRYVFFEFRDSYVLSLWTFDVHFTYSHIMAMVQ